ncbi:MAG: methionyl-tRNA formyltransferase [Clostridiales Family XIII bacterium]|jgi:methionyl-tRNA formyltransferase|nr:methionyl-tRNA formyltransferase [Clostridiales Family XIII bacterium]
MRIVYMGTPEFAVPPLRALCECGRAPVMTVTQPDRRRDRGKRLQSPPVKDMSGEYAIPVIQPLSLTNNTEFRELLTDAAPDLIVVAAYGRILPADVLSLPRLGCINIHASILPAYRGAAPIQRAVMNGERETGVTLMHMAETMDTGDIIAVRKTNIENKTAGELFDELSRMGARLLTDTLPCIETGRAPRRPQDESKACYAPMIRKEDAHVDFSKSSDAVCSLIRGMNPHPIAFARMGDAMLKLWEAFPIPVTRPGPAGTAVSISDDGISVAAGDGAVLITVIQSPGKRPMRVAEYLRGNKIHTGAIFT